jgi:hypothetical protein
VARQPSPKREFVIPTRSAALMMHVYETEWLAPQVRHIDELK